MKLGNLFLFLLLNFAALAIGGWWLGDPSTNEWYQSLEKAPWNPPNWMFGVAWTTIMICFSIFLWKVTEKYNWKDIFRPFFVVYICQWLLNVAWNPVFFRSQLVWPALVIILMLSILVGWFWYWGMKRMGNWGWLMAPYFIWLMIALSLNAYIFFANDATQF
ncbi:MAG: TspO/MBR family protein [Saprospiraceae bacterium]|jgi:tryptophan-rich sensory protein